jgi:hypothetical protein
MVGISRRHLLGGATAVGFAGSALAQTKPIRILVGFAAGGGNDVIARLVAQKMGEGASGQVLVDNKTGASGLIAADILAKAAPDGTTLMVATQTTYAVAPQLYKSVVFDAPRDVPPASPCPKAASHFRRARWTSCRACCGRATPAGCSRAAASRRDAPGGTGPRARATPALPAPAPSGAWRSWAG